MQGVLLERTPLYLQEGSDPWSSITELTQTIDLPRLVARIPARPAPQVTGVNVTDSHPNATRPQLYVLGLGGWLDTCQYDTPRDRIFLGYV
jgi:hypothetical protein